jgi:hypothetical protein
MTPKDKIGQKEKLGTPDLASAAAAELARRGK